MRKGTPVITQWSHLSKFPRGGFGKDIRFDVLARDSDESAWESFEDLENVEGDPSLFGSGAEELLYLIDPVATDADSMAV